MAESGADKVYAAAMGRIERYFQANAKRMGRALHPELRRCFVCRNPVFEEIVVGSDRAA